jgi:hypothetical protein
VGRHQGGKSWDIVVLLSAVRGVPRSVLLINCLVTLLQLLDGGSLEVFNENLEIVYKSESQYMVRVVQTFKWLQPCREVQVSNL